ncbi:translation initiation factor IF-2-like [Mirounga leonina]|uniref:translation initiation factor IF-2-like n=1 Tax=Mirounga leonina TaxID=9715 RepID=UPI00156C462F|nr:translation initiation factor IF-2-like [Mirounga leonina]
MPHKMISHHKTFHLTYMPGLMTSIFLRLLNCGGDTEALAVKPGILRSGAGFLEHRHAARAQLTPPARRSNPRPAPAPSWFPLCSCGAQTELSAKPPPTQVAVLPGQVPTLAAGPRITPPTLRGTRRVLISDLGGPREGPHLEPRGRLSSSRRTARYRLGTAAKWTRGASRAPPQRPPRPAPRSAPSAGLRLCSVSRVSPVPGWGWGAVGEVRRESFRCQQPPPVIATARGAPGGGEGPGLLASLPSRGAARGAERGARGRRSLGAGGLTARSDAWAGPDGARATGGGAVPGGAIREESWRATRWLGLDCCTFFFVRCIFRNKKKSPTLHTTSSASLKTRNPATVAWRDGDNRLPCTPQLGLGGTGIPVGTSARAPPEPEHNQNMVNYRPPQPCTYFFLGFRLNTSDPIQFKIFF